jgi:cytochrome bd-type quinol oxidase subunit 2
MIHLPMRSLFSLRTKLITAAITLSVSLSIPSAVYAAGAPTKGSDAAGQKALTDLVTHLIQFMAVGVGVVIVLMMGYAGFQYLTAGDNPNQISQAKKRMVDILIALLLYIFALAFLNWLTPGGVL